MRTEELGYQMETMRNIRKEVGMNRREFSDYMGIPIRTLEEWEAGRRKMPDYVLRLISYQVKMEKLMRNQGIDVTEVLMETNEGGERDEESNLHFLQIANSDKPVAFYGLEQFIFSHMKNAWK